MRIRSTSSIFIDLLHESKDVAKVAQFAAKFRLPMRLGPSTEDSFLGAQLDQSQMAWAFQDSAISVCAQAMVDNKSVDDVLAQIRNQIEKQLNIDPAAPFDLVAMPAEAVQA